MIAIIIAIYEEEVTLEFSVAQAKNQLPQLIHQTEQGMHIQITRYGKPVAILLSQAEYNRLQQAGTTFASAFQRFHQKFQNVSLEPPDLEDLRADETGRTFQI